jgi:hypothetical protein
MGGRASVLVEIIICFGGVVRQGICESRFFLKPSEYFRAPQEKNRTVSELGPGYYPEVFGFFLLESVLSAMLSLLAEIRRRSPVPCCEARRLCRSGIVRYLAGTIQTAYIRTPEDSTASGNSTPSICFVAAIYAKRVNIRL